TGRFFAGLGCEHMAGYGGAKEYAPRYRGETQQGDQCCSCRSRDGSADCKLWLHGVCKFVRRVRQVHRRGYSEMGQGGEVRGYQAGLIRGNSRIFHNLSFHESRQPTPCPKLRTSKRCPLCLRKRKTG